MVEPRYPYVHLGTSPEEAASAAEALWALGALGIEERDATTLVRAEAGGPPVLLVAAFPDEGSAGRAVAELAERWPARLQHVVGDAWRDAWKAYFKPSRIAGRIVVVPSWERYAARPDEVVLDMDPGAAFGTGSHETTRLVLEALVQCSLAGRRVLDVGSGSGILSIAALKLGAARARAVDVDPTAVEVARTNARRNRVASRLRVDTLPVERLRGRYPWVLANIETRVLVPMAPALAPRLSPGGTLLLSGILAGEEREVERAYGGLRRLSRWRRGEWVCLALGRGGRCGA